MIRKLKGVIAVSQLIGLIVVVLIFGSLIGTVANSTIGRSGVYANESNITGATYTMVSLVPLFLAVFVLLGVIGYIKSR